MNKSPPKPQKGQQFTVVQIKTLSSESSPYSVSSFWLQTNQMKRTYRFKRVTKPKKSIQPDDSIHTSEKSITIGARPKSQSQPQPGILSISNPTLSFNELKILPPDFFQIDALDLALKILPPDFFQIDALDLAPRLLGKLLRRDDVILRITEVEAYRPNDSACHGRFGRTPRTAPVFGPGGHAYVYLCYGLHTMLNVVADKEEVGAAVLVRSCEPVCGLETIQQRRGQITEKPVLLTGPGKVCQALGISTEWSNHRLYTPGKFLLPWLYTFKVNGMKVNNKNGHGYQAVSNSWMDQNQKRYSWVRGWAFNMPCLMMSMPPGDSPLLVLLG